MIADIFGPDLRRAIVSLGTALVLGACASAPAPAPDPVRPGQPAAAVPAQPSPSAAQPPTGPGASIAPPPPGTPESGSPTAKPQSAKLTLEAVDQLQNGDEVLARASLERALVLDPGNELARKLQDQIRADAQTELGATHFRYTVQRDDTLSKLAQLHMGDRYRFYILAKYNDITNPSRLAAGQVIKIPGRPAPAIATPAPAPVVAPELAPKMAEPEVKPREDVAELMQKGSELERAGNFEGAYALYGDGVQRNPGHADLGKRRDAVRVKLLAAYDREATQAFQRQNLDLAIVKWDRILELDPTNRKARLERERALDLKRRMAQKFGKQ